MPTHVIGLESTAQLRIERAAEFETIIELIAPIVRGPDDGEELLACASVSCHPGVPPTSTAECTSCHRLVAWSADSERVVLHCRWSHHDPVCSRMTPAHALVSVEPGCTCAEADALASDHSLRHLIVLDKRKLAGVVCRCDLVDAPAGDSVAAHMATDVFALGTDATLGEAAAVMRDLGLGILPIVSDRLLVGVVTRGDLQRAGAPEAAVGKRPCAHCRERLK